MSMEFGDLFYEPSRFLVDEKQAAAVLKVASQSGFAASIVARAGENYTSLRSGKRCVIENGKACVEIDHQGIDLTDFWIKVDSEVRLSES